MQSIKSFWTKSTINKIVLAVVGIAIIACCSVTVLAAAFGEASTAPATTDNTTAAELEPTAEPVQLATAEPTAAPDPTATPEPATELPPFAELAANSEKMTDAQWNAYSDTLRGNVVTDWTGTVTEVNETLFGGFDIWINVDNDVLNLADVFIPVSEEQALLIFKDSQITFSGTVETVDNLLTLNVRLADGAEYTTSE